LIVISSEPAPTRDLIARYVIGCADSNVEPLLVINKSDLFSDYEAFLSWLRETTAVHEIGVQWLAVSAYQPASTHSLRERIEGRVSMLVGMSGVGKSSLMMALKPGVRLTTQEVSSAHGKGKHTTSVTTLYPLNETTALIDSPGVWEYGLWSVPPERVLAAFPDLARYSDQCKFNDCKHLGEPGCAVRAAVDRDEVAQARLEAFQRIVRTLPAKALWERRS